MRWTAGGGFACEWVLGGNSSVRMVTRTGEKNKQREKTANNDRDRVDRNERTRMPAGNNGPREYQYQYQTSILGSRRRANTRTVTKVRTVALRCRTYANDGLVGRRNTKN